MTQPAFHIEGRSREPELMDGPAVDDLDLARCLRDLERVNRASFGYRPTLNWLARAATGRRTLSIVDAGSGHGDMLRRIWRWGASRGIDLDLIGVDLNPAATRAARAATPAEAPIRFETGNIFDWRPDRQVDIAISALFCHHLDDGDLPRFVDWMEAHTRIGWFVNDLDRHWIPEHFLRATFAVLPVHRFVRHDGPVSVRRGFRRGDLEAILTIAGVPLPVEIGWWFPFRWGVGRLKDGR